jgi:hypothetical protein
MADNARPTRSESARLIVDGNKTGKGVVLLYPDKLASARVMVEYVGIFIGALAGAAVYPSGAAIGVLAVMAGVWLGGAAGRAIDRKLAIRAVAGGPASATIIPLDTVTSLRTDRSAGLGGWYVTETLVVTTADGTEYGFRGRTGQLQGEVASAIASHGREVRATPLGLAVTPQAVANGA